MKQPDYDELEEAIKINPDDLDNELCHHIENYHLVSKGYKQALERRDKLKKELKEKEAYLQFDSREDLQEVYGKVTESMVQAHVEKNKERKKIIEDLLAAEVALGKWDSLKSVYEQRSYALNKLVDLYIAGYFGVAPVYSANQEKEVAAEKERISNAKKSSKKKLEDQTNDKTKDTTVSSGRERLKLLKRTPNGGKTNA